MRFIHFIILFFATACSPSHTALLDDMESLAIGMLEVSQDVSCQDPDAVPEGDYDCEYEGLLAVRVYDAHVGDQEATDVVDIGFMNTELDSVTVEGYADMVVHDEADEASLVGSLRFDDDREYEDLYIEVTLRSENEMHVEGVADGLEFSFDLVRFSGESGSVSPQELCGDLGLPACE